ncbi:MAG: ABC transporter substrate-binding protein, partial [Chloroflexi bacterium]
MRTTRPRAGLLAAVAALVVAGCGNGPALTLPTPTPSRPGPAMVQIENSIL